MRLDWRCFCRFHSVLRNANKLPCIDGYQQWSHQAPVQVWRWVQYFSVQKGSWKCIFHRLGWFQRMAWPWLRLHDGHRWHLQKLHYDFNFQFLAYFHLFGLFSEKNLTDGNKVFIKCLIGRVRKELVLADNRHFEVWWSLWVSLTDWLSYHCFSVSLEWECEDLPKTSAIYIISNALIKLPTDRR